MGQNDAGDVGANNAPNNKDVRIAELLNQQVNFDVRQKVLADAMAPASSSLGERLVDVTKDGFKKIPAGFAHSLGVENILPNVALGVVIGAGTKALLPATGPVGKVIGAGLGIALVGKPVIESYVMAGTAHNLYEMDAASTHLGDTVGGLPVAMVEGGIGAKLGTMGAGRLLATGTGARFAGWRDGQWAKLDAHADAASAGVRNVAFEQLGVGRPVMRLQPGGRAGVVPPHLLEELARTTKDPAFLETIRKTEALSLSSVGKTRAERIAATDFKGAREVYDAKGTETQGTKVRSEGEPATGNVEVDNVYEYTGDVRGYYKDVHGRNSIDGKGMKMESTTNYGDNFENAFWDGSRMTYGKPGASSPFRSFVLRDVTGHEITHGVTEFESGLVYRNQPGALNEHLSDVFGALVTQRALGQSAKDASWLVGENIWKPEIKGRALRDMRNPGTAYDDAAIGKDPQPAHMRDYNKTRGDNGGVHYNSGIPNRAFVLAADAIGGNAYDIPGKIWYEARANAGSSPSFAQFAWQTLEAAKKLGHADLVPKIEKAWTDVGVTPSKTATAGSDAVPILTGGLGADNLTGR